MKVFRFWPLILICFGCTNLQLRVPNPRVDSPEIIAEEERNRWALGYDVGGANTIQPTSDASARPPDLSRPSSMAGYEAQGVAHYGFAKKFQLGMEIQPDLGSAFFLTDMKYKILGDNRDSDFLLTVTIRLGSGTSYRSGDQKSLGGPGGYNWNGRVEGRLIGAAVSFGQYIRENFLWYLGYGYDTIKTVTTVTQDPNVSASDLGGTYTQEWVANNWVAGGGLNAKAGRRFLMDFGIYYYNTRISGADGYNSGLTARMGGQWLLN